MFSPNYFKAYLSFTKVIGLGFLFVGILCAIRLFLCEPTLGWDEAEQAVIAQQFSAGYLAQPPLYYWLQYLVFKGLGINLFSIALLKYSLIFLCVYFYHQICRIHCQDKLLAWCATVSWALIPNISIDLLPHRTHAVASLLAACLTWYWLIKPSRLAKPLWYAVLGIFIGLGLLSKSNYLLFLMILLLSAMTLKEFRALLIGKRIFISLFFICLVSSSYWLWLIDHFTAGTSSAFKLALDNKTVKDGATQLVKAYLIYGIPVYVLSFFFLFWQQKQKIKFRLCELWRSNSDRSLGGLLRSTPPINKANKLLWRYQLLVFPVLLVFVITAGLHDFKTHWALSLFFLSPLLIVSLVDSADYSTKKAKSYLILCVLVLLIIIAAWVNRSYRLASFPLQQLVQEIRKERQPKVTLISPSHWLLGSLMIDLPVGQSYLLHPALLEKPLPEGKLLLVWMGSAVPDWVNVLVPPSPQRKIKELAVNQIVRAGYTYR